MASLSTAASLAKSSMPDYVKKSIQETADKTKPGELLETASTPLPTKPKAPVTTPTVPTKTLENLYKLDTKKMKDQPIQVSIVGNTVHITAYVHFTGDTSTIYPGTKRTMEEIAREGIESIWNDASLRVDTKHDFNSIGISTMAVKTIIITVDEYSGSDDQRFMEIELIHSNKKQGSSTHGTDTIGDDPSIVLGNNYSGKSHISADQFGRAAAHEFGHAMGIGDAYGDDDKNRESAKITSEVPSDDIMRGSANGRVISSNDIEMILEAWSTGERQDFDDSEYGGIPYIDDWFDNEYDKSKVIRSY